MSERIHFSFWFLTQTPAEMLQRLSILISSLPAETQERGVLGISSTALSWSEPALIDERYDPPVPPADALEQLREYLQEDAAAEIEMAWMLWVYEDGQWKHKPQPIRFICIGTEFDKDEPREVGKGLGHLLVEFGLDEPFLAENTPWGTETRRHVQANIMLLLAYLRQLQVRMGLCVSRLWSDEVEDWSSKLVRRMQFAEKEGSPLVQ